MADQRITEYEAEMRDPNGRPNDRTVVVFSIPEGKTLPTQVTSRSWLSSKPAEQFEQSFDITYPNDGPEDVFALNVPKTTKVVDRTADESVRTIAERVWAGRREFDSYHGIKVEYKDADEPWWKSTSIRRVWRSGLKWRIECCNRDRQVFQPIWEEETPSDDIYRAGWRIRMAKKLGSFPESVSDGFDSWVFDIAFDEKDQNGTRIPTLADSKRGHLGWFQGTPLPEQASQCPSWRVANCYPLGGRPDLVSTCGLDTEAGSCRAKLLKILATDGHDAGAVQKHWISPESGISICSTTSSDLRVQQILLSVFFQ